MLSYLKENHQYDFNIEK